jgi:hypothetical protein
VGEGGRKEAGRWEGGNVREGGRRTRAELGLREKEGGRREEEEAEG